ncbi:MAG: cysteine desulfurase [Candidatus Parcubacteria bacterium]|jgi:cysteine desulfurase|nr:cysteine desulfurase [Candidatus Parcubacteria bacterium]
MFKRRIYLDYAGVTPVDGRVLREMKKYSAPRYSNPSSIYLEGVNGKNAVADARRRAAELIQARTDEIIFTSGGTESNNLALQGCLAAFRRNRSARRPHLIISAIEHASIMKTAKMLEIGGIEVTRLTVDRRGLISPDALSRSIKPDTFLVSIMAVNNEIGTVQPIREAVKAVRRSRNAGSPYPLLHTDAAQALLYFDCNVQKLGVDLLTMDGSKICGPRGVGSLYVRRQTPIEPTSYGGGQETGLRSGTENVPAIVGFAAACDFAGRERVRETARIYELKRIFQTGLTSIRPDMTVNPPQDSSDEPVKTQSPHILNVGIPGIDNEFLMLQLDARGVACSTKSSCLKDEDESYVLTAIGAESSTAIRFSFGRWTKKAHIRQAILAISGLLC